MTMVVMITMMLLMMISYGDSCDNNDNDNNSHVLIVLNRLISKLTGILQYDPRKPNKTDNNHTDERKCPVYFRAYLSLQ